MTTRTLLVGGAIAALICAPAAFAAGQSAMQQDQAASQVEAPRVGETEAEAEARRARMMEEGADTGGTEAGAMSGADAGKADMAAKGSGALDADEAAADVVEGEEEEEEEERQTPA